MIPAGAPKQILSAADDLSGVAADLAEIRAELHSSTSGALAGPDGWQGAAAEAFAEHMKGRVKVLGLAEQALAGAAIALVEYAGRLSKAQESTRSVAENALRAGLRLNGDQVDPASLLPPDPAKLLAAADLERQLAESEVEGFWASTQLASALAALQQLAISRSRIA